MPWQPIGNHDQQYKQDCEARYWLAQNDGSLSATRQRLERYEFQQRRGYAAMVRLWWLIVWQAGIRKAAARRTRTGSPMGMGVGHMPPAVPMAVGVLQEPCKARREGSASARNAVER